MKSLNKAYNQKKNTPDDANSSFGAFIRNCVQRHPTGFPRAPFYVHGICPRTCVRTAPSMSICMLSPPPIPPPEVYPEAASKNTRCLR